MLTRTLSFILAATERSCCCFKREMIKHNLICVFKVDSGYWLEGWMIRAQEWGRGRPGTLGDEPLVRDGELREPGLQFTCKTETKCSAQGVQKNCSAPFFLL